MSDLKTNKITYTASDTISVSYQLENTGSKNGSEVIQVYIGKPKSKVKRALKELKGFKKTYLKKGEHATLEIPISISSLAFYDESIFDWNLEKGAYTIYIGNASNTIFEEISIVIK